MKLKRSRTAVALAAAISAFPTLACGPEFPNRLLDGGDQAVLGAPFADFFGEIRRMQLIPPTCTAVPLTNDQSHVQQTTAADIDDLGAALRKAGVPAERRAAIAKWYQTGRAQLIGASSRADAATTSVDEPNTESDHKKPKEKLRVEMPEGLPGEFADYFRGAIAWHNGETNEAISAWQALLDRPATERRFKSTWAAFMLGRAFPEDDKATNYFHQVRALAKEGFADSLGLAASSLGWEAKVHYDQGNLSAAADLYLEQAAAGDPSAIVSLRFVAAKVLKQGDAVLQRFATHPRAQRVITAYLLAEHRSFLEPENFELQNGVAAQWLTAVEATRLKDVQGAEQLALVAYRYGDVDKARRWLKLARNTPVAQWLQAKLLLRDGKVDEAAVVLAKAARYFPLERGTDAPSRPISFYETLYVHKSANSIRSAAEQFWGELGVLRLARREYTEALDALLRAGFWDDAAYVAEQVLTLNELKDFVDRHWPVRDGELKELGDDDELTENQRADRIGIASMRRSLCHLLARRLTRNNRGAEARPYFPKELLPPFDQLITALDAAYDETQPSDQRAKQLMAAARVARNHGVELLATELEPDFAVNGCSFELNLIRTARDPNWLGGPAVDKQAGDARVLFASKDELRRTAGEPADPPIRYHYRYLAAELGWTAAQLLPNNSDDTARILCEAGSWIKYLNPQAADRFYKALVRRCRKTDIGQWADYIRWFPLLDENGTLRPKQPSPPRKRQRDAPAEQQPDQPTTIQPDAQGVEEVPSDAAGQSAPS